VECIVKRLIIRASSLLKGFVLALIFSVFLQASLASATGGSISTVSDLLAITGSGDYVLTIDLDLSTAVATNNLEAIQLSDVEAGVVIGGELVGYGSDTYIGIFSGTLDGGGFTISGLSKPLFGVIQMAPDGDELEAVEVQNLNLESGTGVNGVLGQGALANGLDSGGTVQRVSFVGDVTGATQVGGLIGDSSGGISLSYVTGNVTGTSVDVNGWTDVGGLVGVQRTGVIIASYATGTVMGTNSVGGLVGFSSGAILNSYAASDVTGIDDESTRDVLEGNYVGGLVGGSENSIENSYAIGAVIGNDFVAGLTASYDVITGSYGTGSVNGTPYGGEEPPPNILDVINTGFDPDVEELLFAVSASINDGLPYLMSLLNTYDVVEENTEETPSHSLRSFYTQAAKSLDKALISFGFKSNFSSQTNLGFQALEQNQNNSPAVIQLFEVSEYQNSRILLNKADGLQLSISSYYKEAVEIWTQGLDGEYLYLGLVEFDRDGKAILPALTFDTAKTHQLLLIKAADELSEKPNLERKIGEITVDVF
jgi:hypothetical protein